MVGAIEFFSKCSYQSGVFGTIGFDQFANTKESHACTRNWESHSIFYRLLNSTGTISPPKFDYHAKSIFLHVGKILVTPAYFKSEIKLRIGVNSHFFIVTCMGFLNHVCGTDNYEKNWSLYNGFLTRYSPDQLSDLDPRNKSSFVTILNSNVSF